MKSKKIFYSFYKFRRWQKKSRSSLGKYCANSLSTLNQFQKIYVFIIDSIALQWYSVEFASSRASSKVENRDKSSLIEFIRYSIYSWNILPCSERVISEFSRRRQHSISRVWEFELQLFSPILLLPQIFSAISNLFFLFFTLASLQPELQFVRCHFTLLFFFSLPISPLFSSSISVESSIHARLRRNERGEMLTAFHVDCTDIHLRAINWSTNNKKSECAHIIWRVQLTKERRMMKKSFASICWSNKLMLDRRNDEKEKLSFWW